MKTCKTTVLLMIALTLSLVGCIGLKTGPVETIVKSREPIKKSYTLQANNGISAKLTPDRGQMLMELWWWNRRELATTYREHKQDVIQGTTRIGLFPGVFAIIDTNRVDRIKDPITVTFSNLLLLMPTIKSLVGGPFEDYATPGDSIGAEGDSLSAYGLIGTYKFLDDANPKVIRRFDSDCETPEYSIEEDPIQLTTFVVEIDGRVFHGENGIAHVGSVVGDKTALNVKVLSFELPEGFTTNGVSSAFGYTFQAKVPTATDIAAEEEKKRLVTLAQATQEQTRQDADAVADAAQRETALLFLNAAAQGVNAAAVASSTPAPTPVTTPIRTTPTVMTPAPAKTYLPKTIPKYTIVPRAPSFGLSDGTSSDSGTRYKTGLQRVR